jgi:hypothetical protein
MAGLALQRPGHLFERATGNPTVKLRTYNQICSVMRTDHDDIGDDSHAGDHVHGDVPE